MNCGAVHSHHPRNKSFLHLISFFAHLQVLLPSRLRCKILYVLCCTSDRPCNREYIQPFLPGFRLPFVFANMPFRFHLCVLLWEWKTSWEFEKERLKFSKFNYFSSVGGLPIGRYKYKTDEGRPGRTKTPAFGEVALKAMLNSEIIGTGRGGYQLRRN